VLVAVPAAVVAYIVIIQGGPAFPALVLVLGLIGLHELYTLLDAARPVKAAGFVTLAGLVAAAYYGDQFQVLLVAAALLPLLFGLTVARPWRAGATISMAVSVFGVYWIGFAVAHAVLLRELPHGDGILIDILVGTFLGDTGAYFGGRLFGQRKLAPWISPNKTVEGLVIGMAVAMLATWFAGTYQDWLKGWEALLLGAGVAIAAPIGDLFESLIKRDVGTKDTGGLFGAHGGALDRLDAVFFTVPTGFYIWSALL
jgi:phosphatidate cytidylyltransferase